MDVVQHQALANALVSEAIESYVVFSGQGTQLQSDQINHLGFKDIFGGLEFPDLKICVISHIYVNIIPARRTALDRAEP